MQIYNAMLELEAGDMPLSYRMSGSSGAKQLQKLLCKYNSEYGRLSAEKPTLAIKLKRINKLLTEGN